MITAGNNCKFIGYHVHRDTILALDRRHVGLVLHSLDPLFSALTGVARGKDGQAGAKEFAKE